MKFILLLALCAVLAVGCSQAAIVGNNSGAKVCVINTGDCNSTNTVCGRFGRSDLCRKFRNRCALETLNCGSSTTYNIVSNSYCSGIAVNNRARCNGSFSSSTSSSNGILGNLLGSSSNNGANVIPIIIKRG